MSLSSELNWATIRKKIGSTLSAELLLLQSGKQLFHSNFNEAADIIFEKPLEKATELPAEASSLWASLVFIVPSRAD